MSTFAVFVIGLTFFAAPLPLSFLTLVWGEVSYNLAVGIPYVSILRTLMAAGAVLACIICDKLKGKRFAVDLVVIAVNLEALSILGFSLSRVFWNLALWSFLLGCGLGMSLTFLSLGLVYFKQNTVIMFFAFSAAGTACGAWILDTAKRAGHSWRTDCQILAICQILISLLSFFLIRNRINKKSGMQLLQEEKRAFYRRRESDKRGMEKSKGPCDAGLERRYFLQMGAGYLAAFLCGFLILAMALLPANYLVENSLHLASSVNYAVYGVVIMAFGLMAGRLLASFLKIKTELLYAVCCVLFLLLLISCAIIMHDGTAPVNFIFAVQFLSAIALGPLFPCLLTIDDVRLDRDRENSFTGLLPAFYLGSLAFITPAAQALSGVRAARFAAWMLLPALILSLALYLICRLPDR